MATALDLGINLLILCIFLAANRSLYYIISYMYKQIQARKIVVDFVIYVYDTGCMKLIFITS